MTPTLLRRPPPRGSTLLMVTVLLGVLAVVGVAAVSLGSQERIAAGAKGRKDMMGSCAAAARLLVWAELAKYGSGRLKEPMPEQRVTLGDGTMLSFPAHHADDAGMQVVNLSSFPTPASATGAADIDCTNSYCRDEGLGSGGATTFFARCRDARGREIEVEFSTMLLF